MQKLIKNYIVCIYTKINKFDLTHNHSLVKFIVLSSKALKKSSQPPINFPSIKTKGIVSHLYLYDY